MNAKEIIDLISSIGFPAAMCAALFYYMMKQEERNREDTEKLSNTLADNTKVLAELSTLIKNLIK